MGRLLFSLYTDLSLVGLGKPIKKLFFWIFFFPDQNCSLVNSGKSYEKDLNLLSNPSSFKSKALFSPRNNTDNHNWKNQLCFANSSIFYDFINKLYHFNLENVNFVKIFFIILALHTLGCAYCLLYILQTSTSAFCFSCILHFQHILSSNAQFMISILLDLYTACFIICVLFALHTASSLYSMHYILNDLHILYSLHTACF